MLYCSIGSTLYGRLIDYCCILTACCSCCCCCALQVLTILQGNGPFSNSGVLLEAEAYSNIPAHA